MVAGMVAYTAVGKADGTVADSRVGDKGQLGVVLLVCMVVVAHEVGASVGPPWVGVVEASGVPSRVAVAGASVVLLQAAGFVALVEVHQLDKGKGEVDP